MKYQRLLTHTIVLTVAVVTIVSGCSGPKTPSIQTKVSGAPAFVGEWCNTDFRTGGITRVHIQPDANTLKVHMWGRCHPTECDWGEATATIHNSGQLLSVEWEQSFVVRTQTLQLMPDGTLEVITHSHYIDNSGRPDRDSSEYYEKGLLHDWSDEEPAS